MSDHPITLSAADTAVRRRGIRAAWDRLLTTLADSTRDWRRGFGL